MTKFLVFVYVRIASFLFSSAIKIKQTQIKGSDREAVSELDTDSRMGLWVLGFGFRPGVMPGLYLK